MATGVPIGDGVALGDEDRPQEAGQAEGTSVSTFSVDTSKRASSTSIGSPTCLHHAVMVPSVTVSPSWGIAICSIAPHPRHRDAIRVGQAGGRNDVFIDEVLVDLLGRPRPAAGDGRRRPSSDPQRAPAAF